MKKFSLILLVAVLASLPIFAQQKLAPNVYWIQFTDKNNSPFTIDKPEKFLSERALERRERYNIPVDMLDIPVNTTYVNGLKNLGLEVLKTSKWLNAALVKTTDYSLVEKALELPYVKVYKQWYSGEERISHNNAVRIDDIQISSVRVADSTVFNYGNAANQIKLMNGHYLHNQGFSGQGMVIAVIDAGFTNANTLPAFDSLWANNQILGTRDFVRGGAIKFNEATHGMQVLSTIGGNIPGRLVGTAPDAHFWLLRSEDAGSEYPIEEFNWACAAEFADSVGVDVINSSLGYSEFDETALSYTYSDMDGETAYSSIAASIAADKGILVVNSAGNSGDESWRYITSPADAFNILTVGGVDAEGDISYFSSFGPTYDKRVKPNVCAKGSSATVQDLYGVSVADGTSFSSPIMAGMVTCLWQAFPQFTNVQIIEAVQRSGNKFVNPDPRYGYGIPDFALAALYLKMAANETLQYDNLNEMLQQVEIAQEEEINVELFDLTGNCLYSKKVQTENFSSSLVAYSVLSTVEKGMYYMRLSTETTVFQQPLMKN